MDISEELPIVFTVPILLPGFRVKIELQVEEHSNLLQYLLKDICENCKPKHNLIGILPRLDWEMVNEKMVIGTVGLIQGVVKPDWKAEVFSIDVEGVCRFQLKEIFSKFSFKTGKIDVIDNYKELVGDKNEIAELITEFKTAFNNWITSNKEVTRSKHDQDVSKISKLTLYESVQDCLQKILLLTQSITYHILKAMNLNQILRIIIYALKYDSILNISRPAHSVTPVSPAVISSIISSFEMGKSDQKMSMSELQDIEIKLKKNDLPKNVHAFMSKEFARIKGINFINPDYTTIINYINYVINLPWNKCTKESLDLAKAKNVLELNHYGLDKVKKRIVQFIAVRILNPEVRSSILCFIGPPGVGKTTIAKTIADSLNRTFKRVSLGGINHYSDIKGHRRTYIGSMPGCIIEAINQAQSNNPIILLDEIDKMCKGSGGDPAAALLEVLDPEQNSSFVDSFINLPFDLSQVMFISTANNLINIPHTLRDRMVMVYLEGYSSEEKLHIAENYLIPKIFKEHRMTDMKITITTNVIKDIIQYYTSEAGVRDLQNKLRTICSYIAVDIVEKTTDEMKNYVITQESLLEIFNDEYKYNPKSHLVKNSTNRIGFAIGLSWTPVGGEIQVIETTKSVSKSINNPLIITGLAGQTLQESIKIAISWIQSFDKKNELDIANLCIHVHLPGGGIKKDGSSAGITIVCAIVSLIWNIPLKPMIAMTGEISLQGYVLPVGGIKEKLLAAYNSDIRTVIIPALNMNDIITLPKNVRDTLRIVQVNHLKEVLEIVIPGGVKYLMNPTKDKEIPLSKL